MVHLPVQKVHAENFRQKIQLEFFALEGVQYDKPLKLIELLICFVQDNVMDWQYMVLVHLTILPLVGSDFFTTLSLCHWTYYMWNFAKQPFRF